MLFHLRDEQELLQQLNSVAAKRKISTNRYLVDAIKGRLAAEKEQEWREGYEAMGRDPDMDVEYMLLAAQEVIFGR